METLERMQRAGIVLTLLEKLRGAGSWGGETHVQKATYFLQELLETPMAYKFVPLQIWPVLLRP